MLRLVNKLLTLFLVLYSSCVYAGTPANLSWKQSGYPASGYFYPIIWDAGVVNKVWAGSDVSGIWYSLDAGLTWNKPVRAANARGNEVAGIIQSKEFPSYIAYTSRSGLSTGVWLSKNAGTNWSNVGTQFRFSKGSSYKGVAFDRSNPEIIYVGEGNTDYYSKITGGDFASSSGWVLGTGWAIAGGVASHTAGSTEALHRSLTLTSGAYYYAKVTVSNYTSGNIQLSWGGVLNPTVISANGTYYLEFANVTSGDISVIPSSDFVGSIDNLIGTRTPFAYSSNGGTTWTYLPNPLHESSIYYYGSIFMAKDNRHIFIIGYASAVSIPNVAIYDRQTGTYTTTFFSGTYSNYHGEIREFTFNGADYNCLSIGKGIYCTTDYGQNWQTITVADLPSNRYVERFDVAVVDNNVNIFVADKDPASSFSVMYVRKSLDFGLTWTRGAISRTCTNPTSYNCQFPGRKASVAINPNNPSTVLMGHGWGILRTDNFGTSFIDSDSGAQNSVNTDVQVAPNGCLFTSGMDVGIQRSCDNGVTWTQLAPKLPNYNYPAWQGHYWKFGIMGDAAEWQAGRGIIIVLMYPHDPVSGEYRHNKVFRSADNGVTWSKIVDSFPPYEYANGMWGTGYPRSLAVSANGRRIWIGTDGNVLGHFLAKTNPEAGNLNGTYRYRMSCYSANYEAITSVLIPNSWHSAISSVNKKINLYHINVCPSTVNGETTLGRKIYRTKTGGSTTGPFYLLPDGALNNTVRSFTDNNADASLLATTYPVVGGSVIAISANTPTFGSLPNVYYSDDYGLTWIAPVYQPGYVVKAYNALALDPRDVGGNKVYWSPRDCGNAGSVTYSTAGSGASAWSYTAGPTCNQGPSVDSRGYVYIGSNGRKIWKSTTGGYNTWSTMVTFPTDYPSNDTSIDSVFIDPLKPNRAFISYAYPNIEGRVWMTEELDKGASATWVELTGDLPLYCGFNKFTVNYSEGRDGFLYGASYCSGVWKLDLSDTAAGDTTVTIGE